MQSVLWCGGMALEANWPMSSCWTPASPDQGVARRGIAMVMHSCEMPEGNYWGRRVAEAAIETLHPNDFVGMVEFDWDAFRGDDENAGCVWVLPMQRVGDRKAAFAATAALTYGDMPV